jgi:hypothetical protein
MVVQFIVENVWFVCKIVGIVIEIGDMFLYVNVFIILLFKQLCVFYVYIK